MHLSKFGTTAIQKMKEYHRNTLHAGDRDLLLDIYKHTDHDCKYVPDSDYNKTQICKRVLNAIYYDFRFNMHYGHVTLHAPMRLPNRRVRVFQVKDEYWYQNEKGTK